MAKMNLEQLRALRNNTKKEMDKRESEGKDIQVIVGMGTCGIAAGAKESLDGFMSAIEAASLTNVVIKQTGCMGLCSVEPTVEVKVPGMPDTIYGNVDAAVAKEIVEKHLVRNELVSNHIFDRPATDIVK